MRKALGLLGLVCTVLLLLPCALQAQKEKSTRTARTELVYPTFGGVRLASFGRGEARALKPYRLHRFDAHYEYREINVRYPDFTLTGVYGELAAVNRASGDSALIRFSPWVESTAGLASSEVAKRARSADFLVTDGCNVSFWRMLGMRKDAHPTVPALPRNVAWVLEARRSSDGARVAVLDSIGFFQQEMKATGCFPAFFGFADNDNVPRQRVDFPLHKVVRDSVYLVWSVVVPGSVEERCTISDTQRYDEKFSEALERKIEERSE
ncbi:MAG: hypothetical protein IPP94_02730 [Ignavibacteria bacterium]|nr:hypothetical protein [Ignavibacteria bacterium]